MARMHHTNFKAPAAEGEKGIGKLRVWERNGLGRLRVSRAIGAPSAIFHSSRCVTYLCRESREGRLCRLYYM